MFSDSKKKVEQVCILELGKYSVIINLDFRHWFLIHRSWKQRFPEIVITVDSFKCIMLIITLHLSVILRPNICYYNLWLFTGFITNSNDGEF